MKKNLLVMISFCLLSIALISAKHHRQHPAMACKTKQTCTDLTRNCQCFCAVKGDYRHKIPNQDHPIFFDDATKDKFHKGCYCAARDIKILEAESKGMPHYKALEKYQNYNSPSEKLKKRVKAFTPSNS